MTKETEKVGQIRPVTDAGRQSEDSVTDFLRHRQQPNKEALRSTLHKSDSLQSSDTRLPTSSGDGHSNDVMRWQTDQTAKISPWDAKRPNFWNSETRQEVDAEPLKRPPKNPPWDRLKPIEFREDDKSKLPGGYDNPYDGYDK